MLAGLLAGLWLWCGAHGIVAAILNWLAFVKYQVNDDNRPVWEFAEWLVGLTVGFSVGFLVYVFVRPLTCPISA